MKTLSDYLNEKQHRIESALDAHLPSEETRPKSIHRAMRYSTFAGGKRLRPILCLATAEALGAEEEAALWPALALELLHTYTIIHDDLPAMDDDDMRRGKPTCHKQFSEAHAILAGDALLTLAFEWLSECQAPPPYLPSQYTIELAQSAGSRGLIAGQVEDIESEQKEPTLELLEFIHLHKTAALFRAATHMGAISAAAPSETLDALGQFGCNLGLAFQMTDDILNATGREAALGKAVGSDLQRGKVTYVALEGIEAARTRAASMIDEAIGALGRIDSDTDMLEAIARYCIERSE